MYPDAQERKDHLASATAAAAKKLREEAEMRSKQAEDRAAERATALIKEAAVEYLRVQFGKKQAPTPAPLLEKLKKACRCHLVKAAGLHKDTCPLSPFRLKSTLEVHEQSRDTVKEQLRKRTSLSAAQVESAITHLFGAASSGNV